MELALVLQSFRKLPKTYVIATVILVLQLQLPSSESLGQEKVASEAAIEFSAEDLEFFEAKVRPILVNRCFECHGPESTEANGGLVFADRESIIHGGDSGNPLAGPSPEQSLFVRAVRYGDVIEMPPSSRLPQEEIDILTDWVKRKSPWPKSTGTKSTRTAEFDLQKRKSEHWCWEPIKRPSIPTIARADWPLDDMDRFVLSKLEEQKLEPANETDRLTWLRRVTLLLTGLPPSLEEQQNFASDTSVNAYEKVVDRLLDSPQYGERFARHWMDLMRYAETCGHEFDFPIPGAYQYRDYLIRTLNADLPYDAFIREHVAGDLLPTPRLNPTNQINESLIATGFWFLGEATHAPVDVKGDEAGRIDNQIDVLSRSFLGLTVACARCHDHKFDAISTRDYYSLSGFVQSSRRQLAMLDPDRKIETTELKISEQKKLGTAAIANLARNWVQEEKGNQLSKLFSALATYLSSSPRDDAAIVKAVANTQVAEQDLRNLIAAIASPELESKSHQLHVWNRWLKSDAGSLPAILKDLKQTQKQYTDAESQTELLADFSKQNLNGWFTTGALSRSNTLHGEWSGSGLKLNESDFVSSRQLSDKSWSVLRSPTFEITKNNILWRIRGNGVQVRLVIDGFIMNEFSALLFSGCLQGVDTAGRVDWVVQGGDISRYKGHRAHLEVIDHGGGGFEVAEVRFSDGGGLPEKLQGLTLEFSSQDSESADSLFALTQKQIEDGLNSVSNLESELADKRNPNGEKFWNWLVEKGLVTGGEKEVSQIAGLENEVRTLAGSLPDPILAPAIADGTGEDEFVFVRGNHRNLGTKANRNMIEALQFVSIPTEHPTSGRLELANQIASPENPLTARVAVNRLWYFMFGKGIVTSIDNFGVLGEKPTHPELLDYLADEFIKSGWSQKAMLKRLALSRTFRLSNEANAHSLEKDPANVFYHCFSLKRLEGEAIRDSILSASGRLDKAMFGPSVPIHLTPSMQGRGRPGGSGPLDGNRRRSLYIEVRRNFLSPMMLAFDTPPPFSAVGKRNNSNVPAQALILLNDPFVHEQADWMAARLLAEGQDDSARIDLAYKLTLGRAPTASEKEAIEKYLAESRASGGGDAEVRAAWKDVCHMILNLKEFIYVF